MVAGYSLLDVAQILGAVSTLFLIYLYYRIMVIQSRQTDIQETQSSLMEQQNELLAASHKPAINVGMDDITVEDNDVILQLTNLGNGIAQDLTIRCDPHVIGDPSTELSLASSSNPLRRVSMTGQQSMSEVGEEAQPEPDSALLPDETDVRFRTSISLAMTNDDGTTRTLPFKQGTTTLREAGIEELGVHFYLEYSDIVGETDEQELYPIGRHAELTAPRNLETVQDQGNQSATAGTITVQGSQSRLARLKSWLHSFG